MAYIPSLIIAAALVYGGIVDYKKREIPNAVPLILITIGSIFGFSVVRSIMGLILPAVLMFTAAKLTKSELAGGDFKLLCATGFACGLGSLAVTILLACIGALAYSLIRRLPVQRHIPLCTYIAPAYLSLQVLGLVMGGG